MMMRLHETSLFAVKIIDFPVFDESVTDGRTDRPTDGPTDGPTDIPGYRDARTHLKMAKKVRRQLSPDYLKKLYKSIPRSVPAVVDIQEGHSKY